MKKNYESILELLQAWGHYRSEGTSYYHSNSKIVHHVSPPDKAYYMRVCHTCHGTGRVKDACIGRKTICPECNGKRKFRSSYEKVDPRMIAATGQKSLMYVVYNQEIPEEFQRIDTEIMDWFLPMACILTAHYCYYPSHGRDNSKRMAWTDERLLARGLPKLDGEVMYLGLLRAAQGRLARLFGLPEDARRQKLREWGKKGGENAAKKMSLQEKVDRARNASLARWRETLHMKA